jgi:PadR family transcriptional regulator PadR
MNEMNENFNVDNWSTQLRKGIVELCILNMLEQKELYGYDLVRRLTQMSGLGIAEGSVYPLLSRMRRVGLLTTRLEESPSGPVRKYYALTPAGQRCWETMNAHWHELVLGVDRLYSQRKGDGHEDVDR